MLYPFPGADFPRTHALLAVFVLVACGSPTNPSDDALDTTTDATADTTIDATEDADSHSEPDNGTDADSGSEPDTEDAGPDPDGSAPDTVEATCDDACEFVADCLVDLCDGFGEGARTQLADRCAAECTSELAAEFLGLTCAENVAAVRAENPTADAACGDPGSEEGLTALYIGHSFGRTFAESLTEFSTEAGVVGHTQEVVFSGGQTGAPQNLWDDPEHRAEIQAILDTGEIDLLIMICCSESFIEDGTDPALELWIDYALAQNPDTRFSLALPWPDFPEEYEDAAEYAALWLGGDLLWHARIDQLRETYPGVEISCLPHGRGALELRHLFEAGELSDVDQMTSGDGDAIFTDPKGHADEILRDLGTLIWLGSIYDVDLTDHPVGDEYEADLIGIAQTVIAEDDHIR